MTIVIQGSSRTAAITKVVIGALEAADIVFAVDTSDVRTGQVVITVFGDEERS